MLKEALNKQCRGAFPLALKPWTHKQTQMDQTGLNKVGVPNHTHLATAQCELLGVPALAAPTAWWPRLPDVTALRFPRRAALAASPRGQETHVYVRHEVS
jgi:hypothetical protein